jgi:hypothetical protein
MQWFKHDTDSTQDAKIKKLLIKYGATGYAIYFHCLELIAAETSETNISFELEHDSEIIADNLHIKGTAEKSGIAIVEEIMRFIISLDLFQESGGRIFCFKLLKRLDTSMTSNTRLRSLIVQAKAGHDRVMIKSCKQDEQEQKDEQSSKKCQGQDDFTTRFERVKKIWNDAGLLPMIRKSTLDLMQDERTAIAGTMRNYSDEDIRIAIENYAKIRSSPEHAIENPYQGLVGFIRGGVEKFGPDADPWETFKRKVKGFETAGEREERERAEAMKRLGVTA